MSSLTLPRQTRRGLVAGPACGYFPQTVVAPGTAFQCYTGPGTFGGLILSWNAGAIHFQVYDGVSAGAGILMTDLSLTSTTVNTFLWPQNIHGSSRCLPLLCKVQAGLQVYNAGANPFSVTVLGDAGLAQTARWGLPSRALSLSPWEPLPTMRAYLTVPVGGLLLATGEAALHSLTMRTTVGDTPTAVNLYDGTDATGVLFDLSTGVLNGANQFDLWLSNSVGHDGVRFKSGIFLQNAGPSTLDVLGVAISQ